MRKAHPPPPCIGRPLAAAPLVSDENASGIRCSRVLVVDANRSQVSQVSTRARNGSEEVADPTDDGSERRRIAVVDVRRSRNEPDQRDEDGLPQREAENLFAETVGEEQEHHGGDNRRTENQHIEVAPLACPGQQFHGEQADCQDETGVPRKADAAAAGATCGVRRRRPDLAATPLELPFAFHLGLPRRLNSSLAEWFKKYNMENDETKRVTINIRTMAGARRRETRPAAPAESAIVETRGRFG